MNRNIMLVKIEWSEDYDGGALTQNMYPGEGCEKYNFKPYNDIHYGYVPPNGGYFPHPIESDDWLVFFVARRSENSPFLVIGWYDNASLVHPVETRPDNLNLQYNGEVTYSLAASRAMLIEDAARDFQMPEGSFRTYRYLRTAGKTDAKETQRLGELLQYRRQVVAAGTNGPSSGRFNYDSVLRGKIEKAAIDAVTNHEKFKGFAFRDRQKEICGYDLQFEKNGTYWCIEVKGTITPDASFFITQNERIRGQEFAIAEAQGDIGNTPGAIYRWRLAMVTYALDDSRRKVVFMTSGQIEADYNFVPLQYRATPKPVAKGAE